MSFTIFFCLLGSAKVATLGGGGSFGFLFFGNAVFNGVTGGEGGGERLGGGGGTCLGGECLGGERLVSDRYASSFFLFFSRCFCLQRTSRTK